MAYVGFDLEIAKDIPDGATDWKALRPLGITCAALWGSEWGAVEFWENKPHMSQARCAKLVGRLEWLMNQGHTIVTWNGLGFDFDVLAEESGLHDRCAKLAMGHVDMMFHLFCAKGWPLGIDAAAKGQGIPGKPEGMSGAKAPVMWAEGKYQEVLDYLANDVYMTTGIAEACEKSRALHWTSKSGRPQRLDLSRGWYTVEQAMKLPVKDNSWMGDPWPRSKFTEWMKG